MKQKSFLYDKLRVAIHWLCWAYILIIFGSASLQKVLMSEGMMAGMESFGFGKVATLLIGFAELIACLGLLAGIRVRKLRTGSAIFLLPFSIGALMVHLAYGDYVDYYDALGSAIAGIVLLASDRKFRVLL